MVASLVLLLLPLLTGYKQVIHNQCARVRRYTHLAVTAFSDAISILPPEENPFAQPPGGGAMAMMPGVPDDPAARAALHQQVRYNATEL